MKVCDKCNGTGEIPYSDACVSGEIRRCMITCNKCHGVTAQEAMDNMNNAIGGWIDLDIDNLPDRFFSRDDIDIQIKHDDWDMWKQSQLEKEERYKTIERLVLTEYKYRYRIQEKKPIQITKKDKQTIIEANNLIWRIVCGDYTTPDMGRELSGKLDKITNNMEIID